MFLIYWSVLKLVQDPIQNFGKKYKFQFIVHKIQRARCNPSVESMLSLFSIINLIESLTLLFLSSSISLLMCAPLAAARRSQNDSILLSPSFMMSMSRLIVLSPSIRRLVILWICPQENPITCLPISQSLCSSPSSSLSTNSVAPTMPLTPLLAISNWCCRLARRRGGDPSSSSSPLVLSQWRRSRWWLSRRRRSWQSCTSSRQSTLGCLQEGQGLEEEEREEGEEGVWSKYFN